MKPRRYSSEGIILARRNYSEADRIIILYSKNYGKLNLLARGVRKATSRKRASLEVFSHIRFSAARGRSIDTLTETEIISTFPKVRKDLKKVALAYYFLEVIGRITKEEKENKALFNLLLKYIRSLYKKTHLKKLRESFIRETLILLGYWPKGKTIIDSDKTLEDVIERSINSARVGKKLLL